MKFKLLQLFLLGSAATAAPTIADTNKVELPENYHSTFVRYHSVDKPNAENPDRTKMRFFYVNLDSLAAAQVNEPVPAGTVLIMEARAIQRDDAGEPLLDASGRFIAAKRIKRWMVVSAVIRGWKQRILILRLHPLSNQ